MDIRIDGTRTTSENWAQAHRASPAELPALSAAEVQAAKSLGIAPEAYARSRYAADLTDLELGARAKAVAVWIERWMRRNAPQWRIAEILWKTIEGKLKVTLVNHQNERQLIFIAEDVIDDLFESGSAQAEAALLRLLRVNLGVPSETEAA